MDTSSSNDQKDRVRDQFNRHAAKYAVSQVHQGGESLDRVVEFAEPVSSDLAVDIATGTGFTGCAVAPYVRRMIATDIARSMLYETQKLATNRRLSNVTVQYADAEALPFQNESLDIVTCRTAPHHFPNPAAFLSEVARTLKPGGRLVISDTCSPESDDVEAWMHRLELLRDATHVRNYRPTDWERMVTQAGLTWTVSDISSRQPMSFDEWIERSGSLSEASVTLRRMMADASDVTRKSFHIEKQGSDFWFSWTYIVFRAVKQ